MKILGIETSCDETAVALVEDGVKVIVSEIASSQGMHEKTKGIVPEVAAREQIKSIIPVLDLVLNTVIPAQVFDSEVAQTRGAGIQMPGSRVSLRSRAVRQSFSDVRPGMTEEQVDLTKDNIDALAVTIGPGLIGSLLVGVETARTLSFAYSLPLIPVNHVLAHLYGAWIGETQPTLPAIGLIISGGHTELIYLKDHGDYEKIGSTRDDALGEAFDKVSVLLGLGYPGGPAVEKIALKGDPTAIKFPRPMINDGYDFSYSGLKTAVSLEVKKGNHSPEDLAASFQEAALEVVVTKALKAVEEYQVKTLIVAGGVAANNRLREMIAEKSPAGLNVHMPEMKYCTDNAVTIASYAFFNKNIVPWQEVKADPGLTL